MGMALDMKDNREMKREMAMEYYTSNQEDTTKENGNQIEWKAMALSTILITSKPM